MGDDFDLERDTGEACEHIRFTFTVDGAFYAIDMVKNVAHRQQGKPTHILCNYCPAAIEIDCKDGKGMMGPFGDVFNDRSKLRTW